MKLIIFTLTCILVKNIKILITRIFLISDQLIGWVNLIISNNQIMNSQPVPNISFDLIGSSISDKEILVSLLLCENNETIFEVKLQLQFTLSLLLDNEVTIAWTDIYTVF